MRNDKMNEFFADNRNAFDDKTPSDRIWRRIEHKLFGAKQVRLWSSLQVWRAAAIILFGLALVQFFGQRFSGFSKERAA